MSFELVIFLLSLISGFASGLLGIGGGVIIIPAFLFLVPFLTGKTFEMSQITGISSSQALFGSFLAFLTHKKYGFIDKDILRKTVIPVILGAFTGSFFSRILPEKILLVLYLCILLISIINLIKNRQISAESKHAEKKAIAVFFISSFFAGSLGLGGAIFFVPALTYFYALPIKNSIGNVTFLVLATGLFSFTGKALSGQVPYEILIYIIIGAMLGAKIGAKTSKLINPVYLKRALLVIMIITALRVSMSLV